MKKLLPFLLLLTIGSFTNAQEKHVPFFLADNATSELKFDKVHSTRVIDYIFAESEGQTNVSTYIKVEIGRDNPYILTLPLDEKLIGDEPQKRHIISQKVDWVIKPGEKITIKSGKGEGIHIYISGYEY